MLSLSRQNTIRMLRRSLGLIALASAFGLHAWAARAASRDGVATTGETTETILIFRHGEKPNPAGFGQLTCQGLNRSLALPNALASYGTPAAIFVPDPAAQINPDGQYPNGRPAGPFSYVRPTATVEPLAVAQGMPVNTQYGYTDTAGLAKAVTGAAYASSTVFIAWEHGHIADVVNQILAEYPSRSGPSNWPLSSGWNENDYDSIYLLEIVSAKGSPAEITFSQACEGLGDAGAGYCVTYGCGGQGSKGHPITCHLPAGQTSLSAACPTYE